MRRTRGYKPVLKRRKGLCICTTANDAPHHFCFALQNQCCTLRSRLLADAGLAQQAQSQGRMQAREPADIIEPHGQNGFDAL